MEGWRAGRTGGCDPGGGSSRSGEVGSWMVSDWEVMGTVGKVTVDPRPRVEGLDSRQVSTRQA